ncbi:redoxin domain-containing protein [Bacillus sp. YZJH907-2]|uniref:Redoxin domain-containing protein n=1 Tax=Halalkalibacter suaedae TaxID=2822140 RepID=A0A941ASN9_9BACI|nr:redoxin domain-containing protein [Bacillus suaedae]
MQENLDLFDDLDADIYAISVDTPENSKALKDAGGFNLTFLTDETYEVLEHVEMRNDDLSYRGVSILDKDGRYIYSQQNDLWGEQIEATSNLIHEQFEEMNK